MTRHSCKLSSKVDVCCNLSIKNFYFSHLKFKKKTNITILCLRNCDLYFFFWGGGGCTFLFLTYMSCFSLFRSLFLFVVGFFFGGVLFLVLGFLFASIFRLVNTSHEHFTQYSCLLLLPDPTETLSRRRRPAPLAR